MYLLHDLECFSIIIEGVTGWNNNSARYTKGVEYLHNEGCHVMERTTVKDHLLSWTHWPVNVMCFIIVTQIDGPDCIMGTSPEATTKRHITNTLLFDLFPDNPCLVSCPLQTQLINSL